VTFLLLCLQQFHGKHQVQREDLGANNSDASTQLQWWIYCVFLKGAHSSSSQWYLLVRMH